jgi:preprotein translocase subunit SecF
VSALGDIYNGDNDFDFPKLWRWGLLFSAALIVASVVSLFTRDLNMGIEFEGGGVWTVPVEDVSVAEAREALADLGEADAKIQLATNEDGTQVLRVQAGTEAVERTTEVARTLAELAGTDIDEVSISTVGPSWGDEITEQALRALVIFLVVVALYMAWRLEWRMAAGAMVALAHDLLISVGIYSIFQFEVTPATVIAFLTILGYSLYDTIVVFDKALENTARAGRQPYRFVMRRSLNQTLMRSINTTIATILPIVSMLLIGSVFLGAETLEDFAIALFVGLASGAYSSVFVASPVTTWLKEREPRFAYTGEEVRRTEAKAAPKEPEPAGARPAKAPADRPTPAGAIPPRPRKAKKRRR